MNSHAIPHPEVAGVSLSARRPHPLDAHRAPSSTGRRVSESYGTSSTPSFHSHKAASEFQDSHPGHSQQPHGPAATASLQPLIRSSVSIPVGDAAVSTAVAAGTAAAALPVMMPRAQRATMAGGPGNVVPSLQEVIVNVGCSAYALAETVRTHTFLFEHNPFFK